MKLCLWLKDNQARADAIQRPALSSQLSTYEIQMIQDALSSRAPDHSKIVSSFGITLKKPDLIRLHDCQMLNDEIVNFYFGWIQHRAPKSKKAYCFSSFFFDKLSEGGHPAVTRWTRKVEIFKHGLVFIPVHVKPLHSALIVIDMKLCSLKFYDSLGGVCIFQTHLASIKSWMEHEHLLRKTKPLSWEHWKQGLADNIPLQTNGSDCGVYMCEYARCLAMEEPISFLASDLPKIRERMAMEALNLMPCRTRSSSRMEQS